MRVNPKDVAAGTIFIAIGLFFSLNAWFTLSIGAARSMGPGYFPVLFGVLLVGLGLIIVLMAIGRPREAFGKVSWRGLFLVTVSIVFFAVTVRGLGMAPALGGATVMAAMSSKRLSLIGTLITGASLTLFSVLVFIYALRLPYPVIGPWLKF
jgi:hypothetical protein